MVKGKNEWHFYIAWSCVVPGIGLKNCFFSHRSVRFEKPPKSYLFIYIYYMGKGKMLP